MNKNIHNTQKRSIINYSFLIINCILPAWCLAQSPIPTALTITTDTLQATTVTKEAVFTINSPNGTSYVLEAGDPTTTVNFEAGEEIYLGDGFEVQQGAIFCATMNPAGDNPARLKDALDGSFYLVKNGVLKLIIEEDYYVNAQTVDLIIKDEQGNTALSNTTVTKNSGVNSLEINLRSNGSFAADAFYIVEVTNEKNNKKVLRIKYQ